MCTWWCSHGAKSSKIARAWSRASTATQSPVRTINSCGRPQSVGAHKPANPSRPSASNAARPAAMSPTRLVAGRRAHERSTGRSPGSARRRAKTATLRLPLRTARAVDGRLLMTAQPSTIEPSALISRISSATCSAAVSSPAASRKRASMILLCARASGRRDISASARSRRRKRGAARGRRARPPDTCERSDDDRARGSERTRRIEHHECVGEHVLLRRHDPEPCVIGITCRLEVAGTMYEFDGALRVTDGGTTTRRLHDCSKSMEACGERRITIGIDRAEYPVDERLVPVVSTE